MKPLLKSIAVSAIANTGSLALAAWVFPQFEVRPNGFITGLDAEVGVTVGAGSVVAEIKDA